MLRVSASLRNSQSVHLKRLFSLSTRRAEQSICSTGDGSIESSGPKSQPDNAESIVTKIVKANDHVRLKRLVFECDPYDVLRREINLKSTQENPNIIPSESNKRITGCICAQEMSDINWMELRQGETTQCFCGHWFKLVTYEQYFEKVKLSKTLNKIYSML